MQQLSFFFNQIHCISLVSFIHIDSIRRVKAKQYGFICQNALRNFPPVSEKSTALIYITKDFHASMWFNMVLNKGIWKVFWSGKFPWSPKSFTLSLLLHPVWMGPLLLHQLLCTANAMDAPDVHLKCTYMHMHQHYFIFLFSSTVELDVLYFTPITFGRIEFLLPSPKPKYNLFSFEF